MVRAASTPSGQGGSEKDGGLVSGAVSLGGVGESGAGLSGGAELSDGEELSGASGLSIDADGADVVQASRNAVRIAAEVRGRAGRGQDVRDVWI